MSRNSLTLFLAGLYFMGLSLTLAAQSASPLVAPLKEGARWTITVTPAAKGTIPEGQPVLKTIRGMRDAHLRKEVLEWSTGTTERYFLPKFLMETLPGKSAPSVSPMPRYRASDPLGGFAELAWIHPRLEKGTVRVGEKSCRFYESVEVARDEVSPSKPSKEGASPLTITRRAWIEMATGRPVAYEDDQYRFAYTFEAADPGLVLTLPEAFRAELLKLFPHALSTP